MILAFLRGSYAFLWHKVDRGLLVTETVFEITSKSLILKQCEVRFK